MNILDLIPNNLPEYWIYAVNLSYDLDEEQVKNIFSQCGTVIGFTFIYDKNGTKKGHARIAYRTKDEAIRALAELHNFKYAGRGLKVNWDKAMVLKYNGNQVERVTELLKKSETDRSISLPESADSDTFTNTNQTDYKKTLGNSIDRNSNNPYELLFKKQIDSGNFPFIFPKND